MLQLALCVGLALLARAQDGINGLPSPASNSVGFAAQPAGVQFPILNLPAAGQPLPVPPTVRDSVYLELVPNEIRGPGDNSTNPYVLFTARVFNDTLTPAVARVAQGSSLRVRVCNNLSTTIESLLDPDFDWGVLNSPSLTEGINGFRDTNTYATHFHGLYGNPGTNNVPCDPPARPDSLFCVRGDNVFADIAPGQCGEYQYDISPQHAPGNYWLHPHHHGSASNQLGTASIPVIVEPNVTSGWDFWSDPSCAATKQAVYGGAQEVILHLQGLLMSVNYDGGGPVEDHTGPTDDGMIVTALGGLPADPYCCQGPDPVTGGGGNWSNVGTENGTAFGLDTGLSLQPFYTSGPDAELILVNGAYQPAIALTAGQLYIFRFVDAMLMKWLDLTINGSSCSMGLLSRDGIPLPMTPRLTDHLALASANRAEAFVVCSQPGNFTLQSGYGPFKLDPYCNGTHCELVNASVIATLVVQAAGISSTTLDALGTCTTSYPSYLADTRNATGVHNMRASLMNFTNSDSTGYPSQNCAFNGLNYGDSIPFQEVLGVPQQFDLQWVGVHSFHHHINPYQLISFDAPYGPTNDNGTWQAGDWGDTMMLMDVANGGTIRWVPGDVGDTGTGYTVMHCHLQPHTDEGCMMKIHLVQQTTINLDTGLSQGGKAGVTLAGIFAFAVLVAAPVMYSKRRSRLAQEAREAEQRTNLMHTA